MKYNLNSGAKIISTEYYDVIPYYTSPYYTSNSANQRDQEKRDSYHDHYNPVAFTMIPLVMETTGRMHVGLKRFFKEVAIFASKHLPSGGVSEHRFRSRFLQFWKSRVVVIFLKALATSAMHSIQAITERSSNNRPTQRDWDIWH